VNISEAIRAMQYGRKVARAGWNGKGMWLIYVPGSVVQPRPGTPYAEALTLAERERDFEIAPHIDMFTATGAFQPGWLASQADLLAEDWEVVNG